MPRRSLQQAHDVNPGCGLNFQPPLSPAITECTMGPYSNLASSIAFILATPGLSDRLIVRAKLWCVGWEAATKKGMRCSLPPGGSDTSGIPPDWERFLCATGLLSVCSYPLPSLGAQLVSGAIGTWSTAKPKLSKASIAKRNCATRAMSGLVRPLVGPSKPATNGRYSMLDSRFAKALKRTFPTLGDGPLTNLNRAIDSPALLAGFG